MFKTQAPTMRLTLRVLAHLLRYPDAELRAHLASWPMPCNSKRRCPATAWTSCRH